MARLTFCRRLVGLVFATLMIAAPLQGARAADGINSVAELSRAVKACLAARAFEARSGLAFTVRMGFRRNGELLGTPFVFFQTPNISQKERQRYRATVVQAFKDCAPLPFTAEFGSAMAGRPITFHFILSGGRTITL